MIIKTNIWPDRGETSVALQRGDKCGLIEGRLVWPYRGETYMAFIEGGQG